MIQIFMLALIQGVTEFLPLSSSAHLALLPFLFGWTQQELFLDVALHAGTLGTLLIYFRSEVKNLFQGALHIISGRLNHTQAFLVYHLTLATLPVVIFGLTIDQYFPYLRQPSLLVIGINSIIFGLLFYIADRFSVSQRQNITTTTACLWGAGQTLALISGVSRLGICLTVGRWLGYSREQALRFSLLLGIPSVTAALTLKGLQAFQQNNLTLKSLLGALLSFVIGMLTIHTLVRYLNHEKGFLILTIYRVILGMILLTFSWTT